MLGRENRKVSLIWRMLLCELVKVCDLGMCLRSVNLGSHTCDYRFHCSEQVQRAQTIRKFSMKDEAKAPSLNLFSIETDRTFKFSCETAHEMNRWGRVLLAAAYPEKAQEKEKLKQTESKDTSNQQEDEDFKGGTYLTPKLKPPSPEKVTAGKNTPEATDLEWDKTVASAKPLSVIVKLKSITNIGALLMGKETLNEVYTGGKLCLHAEDISQKMLKLRVTSRNIPERLSLTEKMRINFPEELSNKLQELEEGNQEDDQADSADDDDDGGGVLPDPEPLEEPGEVEKGSRRLSRSTERSQVEVQDLESDYVDKAQEKQGLLESITNYTMDLDKVMCTFQLGSAAGINLSEYQISIDSKLSGRCSTSFDKKSFCLDKIPQNDRDGVALKLESPVSVAIPLLRSGEDAPYAKCPTVYFELLLSEQAGKALQDKSTKTQYDEVLGQSPGLGSFPEMEPASVSPVYRNAGQPFKDYDLTFVAEAMDWKVKLPRASPSNPYTYVLKELYGITPVTFGTPAGLSSLKQQTPIAYLENAVASSLGDPIHHDAPRYRNFHARYMKYSLPLPDDSIFSGPNTRSFSLLENGSVGVASVSLLPLFIDDGHSILFDAVEKAKSASEQSTGSEDVMETYFTHASWNKDQLLNGLSKYALRPGSYRITLYFHRVQDVCLPVLHDEFGDSVYLGKHGLPMRCNTLFVHVSIVASGVNDGTAKVLHSQRYPSRIPTTLYEELREDKDFSAKKFRDLQDVYEWSFQDAIRLDLPDIKEDDLRNACIRIQLCIPANTELHVGGSAHRVQDNLVIGEFMSPLAIINYQISCQGGTGSQWDRWIAFGAPNREMDVMNILWDKCDRKWLCGPEAIQFARAFSRVGINIDPISGNRAGNSYGLDSNKVVIDRIGLGPSVHEWSHVNQLADCSESPLMDIPRPVPLRYQPEGFSRSPVVFPFQMKPKLYGLNVNVHQALQLPAMDSPFFSSKKNGIDAFVKVAVGGSVGYTECVTRSGEGGITVPFDDSLRLPVWLPLPSCSRSESIQEPGERSIAATVANAQIGPATRQQAIPGLPMSTDKPPESTSRKVFRPLTTVAKSTGAFVKKGLKNVASITGLPDILGGSKEAEDTDAPPLTELMENVEALEEIIQAHENHEKRRFKRLHSSTVPPEQHVKSAKEGLPNENELARMRSHEVDWWSESIREKSTDAPSMGLHTKSLDDALHEVGYARGKEYALSPSMLALSVWDYDKHTSNTPVGTCYLSLNDIVSAQMECRRRFYEQKTEGGTRSLSEEEMAKLHSLGVGPLLLPIYGGALWHESLFSSNHGAQNVEPRLGNEFHGYLIVSLRLDEWSKDIQPVDYSPMSEDVNSTPVRPIEFTDTAEAESRMDSLEKLVGDCSILHSPKVALERDHSSIAQTYWTMLGKMLSPRAPACLRARMSLSKLPPLPTKKEEWKSCFRKFTVAAMVYCVSNPPILRSNVPSRSFVPSKMSATLSVGGKRQTTARVREERGQIYFNQLLSVEVHVPVGRYSCPDIFLYITDRDGRRGSYARFNADAIISHTRRWKWGAPPFWATLYGDKDAFDRYQSEHNVGSICVWLGMDLSERVNEALLGKKNFILQGAQVLSSIRHSHKKYIEKNALTSKGTLADYAAGVIPDVNSTLPLVNDKNENLELWKRLGWEMKLEASLSKAALDTKSGEQIDIGGTKLFQVRLLLLNGRHLPPNATLRPHNLYVRAQLGQHQNKSEPNKKYCWGEALQFDHEFAWYPKAPKHSHMHYLKETRGLLDKDCQRYFDALSGKSILEEEKFNQLDEDSIYNNALEIFGSVLVEHELAPEIVLEVWEKRKSKGDVKVASTRLSLRDGKYVDTKSKLREEKRKSKQDSDRAYVESLQGIRSYDLDVSGSIPCPTWVALNPYFGGDWGLTDSRPASPVEVIDFHGYKLSPPMPNSFSRVWRKYSEAVNDGSSMLFGPEYYRGTFMPFSVGPSFPCIPELLVGMQVIPKQDVDAREMGEDFGDNIMSERKPCGLSPPPRVLPPTRKVRVHVALPFAYGLRAPVGNQNVFDAENPVIQIAISGAFDKKDRKNDGELGNIGVTSGKHTWNVENTPHRSGDPTSVLTINECSHTTLSTGETGSNGLLEFANKMLNKLTGSNKQQTKKAPGPVFPFEKLIEGSALEQQQQLANFLKENSVGEDTTISAEDIDYMCHKAAEIAIWEYSTRRYFGTRASFDIEMPDIAKLGWEAYRRKYAKEHASQMDSSDEEDTSNSNSSILGELGNKEREAIEQLAATVFPRVQLRVQDEAKSSFAFGNQSVAKSPEFAPVPPSKAFMGYHAHGFVGECSIPLPVHRLWWSFSNKPLEHRCHTDFRNCQKETIKWVQLNAHQMGSSADRDTKYASTYKDNTMSQIHLPRFMRNRLAVLKPLEDIIAEDDPLFKDFSVYAPSYEHLDGGLFQTTPERYKTTGKIKAAIAIEDLSEGEVISRKKYSRLGATGVKILTRQIGDPYHHRSDSFIPRVLSLCTNPQRVTVRVYVVTATISTSVMRGKFDPHSDVISSAQSIGALSNAHLNCPDCPLRSFVICRGSICGMNGQTIPVPWISKKILFYQRHHGSRVACLTDYGCKESNPINEETDRHDGVVDIMQCLEFETTLPGIPLLNLEFWENDRRQSGQETTEDQDDQLRFLGATGVDLETRWLNPRWHEFIEKGKTRKRDGAGAFGNVKPKLGPVPIETRPLWTFQNAMQLRKPVSTGKVQMWVDMLEEKDSKTFEPWAIEPPAKSKMELRVVIWRLRRLRYKPVETTEGQQDDSVKSPHDLALPPLGPPLLRDEIAALAIHRVLDTGIAKRLHLPTTSSDRHQIPADILEKLRDVSAKGRNEIMKAFNRSFIPLHIPHNTRKPEKKDTKTLLERYRKSPSYTDYYVRALVIDPVEHYYQEQKTGVSKSANESLFQSKVFPEDRCLQNSQATLKPGVIGPQVVHPNRDAEVDRMFTATQQQDKAAKNKEKKLNKRKDIKKRNKRFGRPYVETEHTVFNWRFVIPVEYQRAARRPPPKSLRLELCRNCSEAEGGVAKRSQKTNQADKEEKRRQSVQSAEGEYETTTVDNFDCCASAELDIEELVEQTASQQQPSKKELNLHGKYTAAYVDRFSHLVSETMAERLQGNKQEAFWIPLEENPIPAMQHLQGMGAGSNEDESIEALVSIEIVPQTVAEKSPAGFGRSAPNVDPMLPNPQRLRQNALEELKMGQGDTCCGFM